MPTEHKWMPVFSVIEARRSIRIDHPSVGKGEKSPKVEILGQDFEQRIGTAYQEQDTLVVHLTAFPVDGRLRIRPPRHGEQMDPTSRGKD
jgi:hypothetical protein